MTLSETEIRDAEERMHSIREEGFARSARYDRRRDRVVVALNTGVELAIPRAMLEGLTSAPADDLAEIEISPTGLGLHWPRLDADIYVPGLLKGIFGSKRWMASELGAAGGKARSASKTAAARENGKKGGRPRKAS